MFLRSEDCQREQQSTHHNDHWRSHDQCHQYCGRNIYIDDNPIRSNDVPAPRYGKQYLASEWRIRTPVAIEERIEGEGIPTLMSANQFVWLKYLGVGRRRRSWTTLFHSISVPSHPCRSIPISCAQRPNWSSGADQCRDIPTRGDYDIETVIAMVNASDAFPVRIGV